MAETYSLATKGQGADSRAGVKNLTLPDSSGRTGSMAYAQMQGSQVYCKGPDGSFSWYKFDAERSTPTNPVLLKV